MQADEVVTGIMVCWNTEDLVKTAYESVRKFHPSMRFLIVDGSTPKMACYSYLDSLRADSALKVFHLEKNLGHGRGLQFAIQRIQTPFFLTIDSDIEMLKSPVQAMLDMMEDDTYGVGWTYPTDITGHEFGYRSEYIDKGSMKYLHPYFCLIQLKEYKKYIPFIHHGAPAVNTMLDIHRRGLSDKVIKEFPGLGHTSGEGIVWKGTPSKYIRHDTTPCYTNSWFGGTGAKRVYGGLPHIEGGWSPVYDPLTKLRMF